MPNKNDKNKKDCSKTQNAGGKIKYANCDADGYNNFANCHANNSHNSPRRIKGRAITKKTTLTDSVAGFVNEVITNVNSKNEPIKWAKIQQLQTGLKGKDSSLIVIIIGLARGYQIYFMENGEFEEVISIRNVLLKDGLLLPFKVDGVDSLASHRPIFASVLEECSSDGNTLCFTSLNTGETFRRNKFDSHINEIDFSSNCFLVLLAETIIIYNNNDLIERLRVKVPKNCPIFALSGNLVAFADENCKQSLLSCGFSTDIHETDNHVMLTAKKITKTMTSFGGSLVSSITPLKTVNNNGIINNKAGIVTIVNIDPTLKMSSFTKNKIQTTNNLDYIAHFCAHKNSKIGHLMFGKGGHLLLTGSSSSTIFNIFLIHIHPKNSSLSCIQHIYSLVRGNSTAKVISSIFSSDNRWVAISTNHGSTHLFAITPFGGRITTRTHNGKFMNKESRFEKTAGIIRTKIRADNCSELTSQTFRTHPGTKNSTLTSTVSNECLSNFDVKPIVLCSLVLAKQTLFSSENFCAWASDNTPNILQTSNGRFYNKNDSIKDISPTKRAVVFTDTLINKQQQQTLSSIATSLMMLEGDGILTQYGIDLSNNLQTTIINKSNILKKSLSNDSQNSIGDFDRENCNRKSCDSRRIINNNALVNDSLNNAKLIRMTEWELNRSNSSIDFEAVNPPLHANNSLMKIFLKSKGKNQLKYEKNWLPFLEVITYSGPHRRLWLGPQFCFNVHTISSTSSECTDEESGENFISQVNGLKKCCPVLIEKEQQQVNGFIKLNEEMVVAKIVCGSWSSEIDSKSMDGISGKLKEKIDEAMRDTNLNEELDDSERQSQEDLMTLSNIDI